MPWVLSLTAREDEHDRTLSAFADAKVLYRLLRLSGNGLRGYEVRGRGDIVLPGGCSGLLFLLWMLCGGDGRFRRRMGLVRWANGRRAGRGGGPGGLRRRRRKRGHAGGRRRRR